MTEIDKYAAQNKYRKKTRKTLTIDLNVKTEQDIINWLESQGKKQTAVKNLIRQQIKKGAK